MAAAPTKPPEPVREETPPNGVFTYTLMSPLSPKRAAEMAALLAKCRYGTRIVQLKTRDGQTIEGWQPPKTPQFRVNQVLFEALAKDARL